MPHPRNTEADFWARVDRSGDCWLWTGAVFQTGGEYGRTRMGGKQWRTHRLAWVLTHGAIPPGLDVLHSCDNPPCCNPEHLFLGTNVDNIADRHAKGRDARGLRHGRHTKPERTCRGDDHWTRRFPERVRRGPGIFGVRPHVVGERNPGAKLSADQAREVRALAGSKTVTAIARQFGISRRQVNRIVDGTSFSETFARGASACRDET